MRNLFICLCIALFASGCEKTITVTVHDHDENPLLDSSAKVIVSRVVDGDTFEFAIESDTISLRIIGIDAYETRHGARLDSQAAHAKISVDSALSLGKLAKQFADSLLSHKEVLIVRDYRNENFDTYNRLLRHVYYFEGQTTLDFGVLMLNRHYATVDTL
ncbi:MAG: thermonuclease family protein [bacterium]